MREPLTLPKILLRNIQPTVHKSNKTLNKNSTEVIFILNYSTDVHSDHKTPTTITIFGYDPEIFQNKIHSILHKQVEKSIEKHVKFRNKKRH